MNELKEWPPALLVAGVCLVIAYITLPIAIGYLIAPGWGWLFLAVLSLIVARQMHQIHTEEKEQAKERNK